MSEPTVALGQAKQQRYGWAAAWLTAAGLLGLYVFIAAQTTLWDRDEPRFSRATLEMAASGNWLYPTYLGKLRPDKPILLYWVMAGAVRVGGVIEPMFRAPSCLGLAGACLFTYLAARRLASARVAWWAMVMLGTSLLPSVMGTLATADGLLFFFLTGALAVFTDGYARWRWTWRHALGIGLLLGGAWLTKGPVALLMSASMVLAVLWGARAGVMRPPGTGDAAATASQGTIVAAPRGRAMLVILVATGLAVVMFLAWAIPANLATGGQFGRQGLGRHVVQRMVQPAEGHGGASLWQYVAMLPLYGPVILLGLCPWVVHLPGALAAWWGGAVADRRTRVLLWSWALPTVGVMSLVVTKLPHYVLPAFPALAIAMALTTEAAEEGRLAPRQAIWLRRGAWLLGPPAWVLGLVLIVTPWVLPRVLGAGAEVTTQLAKSAFPGAGAVVGGWLIAWTAWVWWRQRQGRYGDVNRILLAGCLVTTALLWAWVVPALEPLFKLSPPVARAIHQALPADTPVALAGYNEDSLNLYLFPVLPQSLGNDQAVVDWAHQPGRAALVITRERWDAAQTLANSVAGGAGTVNGGGEAVSGGGGGVDLGLTEIARVTGINVNKHGRLMELLVLERGGAGE